MKSWMEKQMGLYIPLVMLQVFNVVSPLNPRVVIWVGSRETQWWILMDYSVKLVFDFMVSSIKYAKKIIEKPNIWNP